MPGDLPQQSGRVCREPLVQWDALAHDADAARQGKLALPGVGEQHDGFATTAQCGDAPPDAGGVLLDQDCAHLALERL